jgi:hypothetical protein
MQERKKQRKTELRKKEEPGNRVIKERNEGGRKGRTKEERSREQNT